jgi:polyisoprenoid-binding protein YceI
MNKTLFFVLSLITTFFSSNTLDAQKLFTKSAKVSFYSSTPIEKFDAHSSSGNCVVDLQTGKVEFAALIKSLKFEKALMEEHFNENYMDSHKFPKASFKGQIEDFEKISIDKNYDGKHKVNGVITIRGESKDISTSIHFKTVNGKTNATTEFILTVTDFKIKIPSVVRDQIAKEVEVKIDADLQKL